MKERLLVLIVGILSLPNHAMGAEVCLTTLFAPIGEIQGINKQILTDFEINISHFVLDDNSVKFYGPKDPSSVSSRQGKRILIGKHKVIKIDDRNYNLKDSGKPLIIDAKGGDRWKFAFDVDFYKMYEPRAYESIHSYCLKNIKMGPQDLCDKFTKDLFSAYVTPISQQGCIEID